MKSYSSPVSMPGRGSRSACLCVLLFLAPVCAPAAERVVDIVIEHRKVTQPGEVVRVLQGDSVTLRWHSDEAVELHMHGYDIPLQVEAGRPAEMHFSADISGRYPVSSHGFGGAHSHGHEALFYVEVYPE